MFPILLKLSAGFCLNYKQNIEILNTYLQIQRKEIWLCAKHTWTNHIYKLGEQTA